ncbi:hypothetical protein niasHT_006759 [Heterodera trifolii]|uniref:Uncharacterized protein n=1 Tax=Heterodera trifolii TaxID=157864 RepID=A0ABD2LWQ8_9BILA
MSYQQREQGGYDRRRGGGGGDYGNRRDDRNGGGSYGRNSGGYGRDGGGGQGRDGGGGYGREGGGGYGRDGGGGYGRGGGGGYGRDGGGGGGGHGRGGGGYGRDGGGGGGGYGGGGGGGRFNGPRGQSRSYDDGNSGGGYDSRKRPANGYEDHEPPPSKQKKETGPLTVEVKAKVNGQVSKLTIKEGISSVSDLYEIIVIGGLEESELTNEVALFLGNAAKFLSGKGASVLCLPGDCLVGGKNLTSISSALFSNCGFLQMTGDHLQLLQSSACERIDELHLELNFTILDITSIECKALTKWLTGKKAKKSSKKLLIRPRSREFAASWIRKLQSDRLDNLYQVRVQCEFSLEQFSISCGANGTMTMEMRQDGQKDYLLNKYPTGETMPANHAFQLNGPLIKVSFVAQQKS